MKKLITIPFLLFSFSIQAQVNDSVLFAKHEKQIAVLEQQCISLQQQNSALQKDVLLLEQRTNNIATKLDMADSTIASVDNRYGLQFEQTDSTIQNNETKRQKSVLWGIVIAVLLALVSAIVYLLLRIRIAKKSNDIELLRARADDLNRQIVERMDKELEELQKIATIDSNKSSTSLNSNTEPDHSLVKALAYGITRIEYNLHSMSPDIKGYKQLQIALRKMKDNLRANNYEIVDMLGQEYNEGMTLSNVTFKDDSNIEDDRQIITRVIQPQINYCGKAIQFADIEVSRKEQ